MGKSSSGIWSFDRHDRDWIHDWWSGIRDGDVPGEKIVGDEQENVLIGTRGDDFIVANGGNDLILAGGGDDFVLGNIGEDIIEGGSGDDIIYAGQGNDVVHGGKGDDLIDGNRGSDVVTGGRGHDTFEFNVRPEFLGVGVDTITDFELGEDVIAIKNGDQSLVSFADTGRDVAVYYDGVLIAELEGVSRIPHDTGDFFG